MLKVIDLVSTQNFPKNNNFYPLIFFSLHWIHHTISQANLNQLQSSQQLSQLNSQQSSQQSSQLSYPRRKDKIQVFTSTYGINKSSLHKKWSLSLKTSSVNVIKSVLFFFWRKLGIGMWLFDKIYLCEMQYICIQQSLECSIPASENYPSWQDVKQWLFALNVTKITIRKNSSQ